MLQEEPPLPQTPEGRQALSAGLALHPHVQVWQKIFVTVYHQKLAAWKAGYASLVLRGWQALFWMAKKFFFA